MNEKELLERLEESFAKIFDGYDGSAKLLIENSAGAGKIIGSDFKQIGKIFKPTTVVDSQNRQPLSVLVTSVWTPSIASLPVMIGKIVFEEKNMKKIDSAVGLDKIKLMHSNDSLTDLNSHKDRHSHIGQGKIGPEGFEKLAAFAQDNDIDMICRNSLSWSYWGY